MLAPAGSEPDWAVNVPAGPEGPTARGRLAADPQGRNGQPVALGPEPPSHAFAQHTSGNRPSQGQARLRPLVGFRDAPPGDCVTTGGKATDQPNSISRGNDERRRHVDQTDPHAGPGSPQRHERRTVRLEPGSQLTLLAGTRPQTVMLNASLTAALTVSNL